MNYPAWIDAAFTFCVGVLVGAAGILWFRNRAGDRAAMERQEKGDPDDSRGRDA